MAQIISDSIKYVGVDNTSIRKFENQYPVAHGMSYNSYVILDEKIAVTDTVDICCGDQWLLNLENVLAGRTPDYLVVHHMEPDHSANILAAMHRYPSMTLVAGAKAIAMLPDYFEDADFLDRTLVVKDGDTLALGVHTLIFHAAPMVHWPEVMMSYETSEQVLFSADAFGKFGALSYDDSWLPEARRYYCNIVGKYGPQVQMALKKFNDVTIKTIAPLHGPVLSGDLSQYLTPYNLWSTYTPENPEGVLIAYASIYGSTEQAALFCAETLRAAGAEVELLNLCDTDVSEAVAQAFRMGRILLASPTYDAGLYPAMHDFLYHLRIKNMQRRRFALIENGSWAPIAANLMKEMLTPLKNAEILLPSVTIRGRFHTTDRAPLASLATSLLS